MVLKVFLLPYILNVSQKEQDLPYILFQSIVRFLFIHYGDEQLVNVKVGTHSLSWRVEQPWQDTKKIPIGLSYKVHLLCPMDLRPTSRAQKLPFVRPRKVVGCEWCVKLLPTLHLLFFCFTKASLSLFNKTILRIFSKLIVAPHNKRLYGISIKIDRKHHQQRLS